LTRGEFGYKICICDSASRRCPCQRLKLSILFIYAIHMFLWDLFTCFRRDSEVYLIANHKAIQPCLIPFVTLITCTEHLIYGFKNISFAFPCTLKPLLYMWFSFPFFPVVSILMETRRSSKPDPWQQHAGPRAWRRRDRGGGRRGRGSLFVGKMLSVFVVLLSLFFFSFCLAVPGIL
jgi:hypothetical protein